METKTSKRYALVNGLPVVETIIFIESSENDKRSRVHDDGKRWFPVAIENPLFDVNYYMRKHSTGDDSNGVVIPDSSDYWDTVLLPVMSSVEVVNEHYHKKVALDISNKNNSEINSAFEKSIAEKEVAKKEARSIYEMSLKSGLPRDVALAIAKTKFSDFND